MFKLPLTKYIKLSHLYCYDPCAGMLERLRDNRELNQHIINSARETATQMWGQRGIYVQTMPLNESPPKAAVLAWLSAEAINPTNHGSELVVIFFTNHLHEVLADLTIVVGSLAWNEIAGDFEV